MKFTLNIIVLLLASTSLSAICANDVSNLEGVSFSKISPVDSSLWIATEGRGLLRIGRNYKVFSYSSAKGDFPCDSIVALDFDAQGVLWMLDSRGDSYNYSSYQGFVAAKAPEGILAPQPVSPVVEEEVVPVGDKSSSPYFRWWYAALALLGFGLFFWIGRRSVGRDSVVEPEPEPQTVVEEVVPETVVTKPEVTKANSQEFYNEIVALVDENFADPSFSVESIAAHFGISRVHLNRKLKGASQASPSELIKAARMKAALELLEAGNCSIVEVAQRCGFSSAAYFSTAFKEYYGKAPSSYLVS